MISLGQKVKARNKNKTWITQPLVPCPSHQTICMVEPSKYKERENCNSQIYVTPTPYDAMEERIYVRQLQFKVLKTWMTSVTALVGVKG